MVELETDDLRKKLRFNNVFTTVWLFNIGAIRMESEERAAI
jgi:hypothetical protein